MFSGVRLSAMKSSHSRPSRVGRNPFAHELKFTMTEKIKLSVEKYTNADYCLTTHVYDDIVNTTYPLQNALSGSREHEDKYQASHPNLRKLDTGGFGASASVDDTSSRQNGYPQNRHLKQAHQTLDTNLDEMCDGLKRLKNLGLGLQSEIDDQDASIDALLNKADKMDVKIHNTNQQIKNLK